MEGGTSSGSAGGAARGAGAKEPGGGRVASKPSLLAGLRAVAQMLFCARVRAFLQGHRGCSIAQAGLGATEGHPSPCQCLNLGTPQDVPSSPEEACPLLLYPPRNSLFSFSLDPNLPKTVLPCCRSPWEPLLSM